MRAGWLLVALAPGCSVPSTLVAPDLELSEGAGFVVALAIKDGVLVGSTGLSRVGPGEASFLVPRSDAAPDHYAVVTFGAASLEAIGAPRDPAVLLDGHLTTTSLESPVLPAPIDWRGYRLEGSTLEPDTVDPFELRAPWQPECPTMIDADATLLSDVSCTESACRAGATQNGCAIRFGLSICGFTDLAARLNGRGELRELTNDDYLGACEKIPARAPARLSLSCRSGARVCAVDAVPDPPDPGIEVETAHPLGQVDLGLTNSALPLTGYFSGMAVLDRDIIISTYNGRFSNFACDAEWDRGGLVAIDPDTMMPRATSTTAPPCINGLAADPTNGEQFILSWRVTPRGAPPEQGEHWIGRYDRDLAPIGAPHRLIDPLLPPDTRCLGISTSTAADAVVLHFSAVFIAGDPDPPRGAVARVNASTLALEAVGLHGRGGEDVYVPVAAIIGDRVLTIDENTDLLQAHRLDTLMPVPAESVALRNDCVRPLTGVGPAAIVYHPRSGRLVLPATDAAGTILTVEWPIGTGCAPAAFPADDRDGWTATIWPADPSLMLIGLGSTDDAENGSLALFDPAALRFVTAELSIGPGLPAHAAVDSQGRVWMTQPGSGTLLRVTAR